MSHAGGREMGGRWGEVGGGGEEGGRWGKGGGEEVGGGGGEVAGRRGGRMEGGEVGGRWGGDVGIRMNYGGESCGVRMRRVSLCYSIDGTTYSNGGSDRSPSQFGRMDGDGWATG